MPPNEDTAVERSDYPSIVQLEGTMDESLSRWLWLVKWILVIPHVIVLMFLWLAVIVLTIGAAFAILFTGRYPRGIFDFNLGVMRWSWRVSFYSYGANGTDRYPPFSMGECPDYPATFNVLYPERLSRGLVLVKSWLLALPHLFVVGLFAGGAHIAGGGGLISLLVLISMVDLLFTSRPFRDPFGFIMGMNRWVYRVLAYVALMRDEYPPFHVDSGPREPSGSDRPHTGQLRPTG